eukprot:CAMPEP_0113313340 /NCGR_PEP_ID=MMETSP0010_2-20120614/9805_1 /TAXON_ID=216773 ORGANISM="Corethron hystrix, Strain 308" /NCGR_SAMPLE_ID=MMETSP0010_2 /ASSEMBLY_ACC=CAM_ASM_000155 /LENGTH=491 /DNA_ID=CAMNT_0000169337 /DNA_START=179 /DNA_END=1654 /DNA_ORIENTATION=- /assembly_acc=CAM_ASM_000155
MDVGPSPQVVNPSGITVPRFAPASAKHPEGTENSSGMKRNVSFPNFDLQNIYDVNVDFDLLADYLLDDIPSTMPGNTVDFPTGNEGTVPNVTCVSDGSSSGEEPDVTPDQTDVKPAAGADIASKAVTVGYLSQSEKIQQMVAAAAAHQNLANLQQMIQQQKSQNEKTDTTLNTTLGVPPLMGSASSPAIVGVGPVVSTACVIPTQDVSLNTNDKKRKAIEEAGGTRQKSKSQAQIDRRRERNRILARRTRLRKKYFFESLQKDVADLQKMNTFLRDVVRTRMSSQADAILKDCHRELPSVVTEACIDGDNMDSKDFTLMKSLQNSQQCFIITDPSLQDNPVVYASEAFIEITGYSRDEILGRNCRFLQGPHTNKAKVAKIKRGIEAGEDVSACIINYAADGQPFWNQLFIAALRDANDTIVNFVGVTVKVAAPSPDDPEANVPLPDVTSSDDVSAPKSCPVAEPIHLHEPVEANEAVDAAILAVDALPQNF